MNDSADDRVVLAAMSRAKRETMYTSKNLQRGAGARAGQNTSFENFNRQSGQSTNGQTEQFDNRNFTHIGTSPHLNMGNNIQARRTNWQFMSNP